MKRALLVPCTYLALVSPADAQQFLCQNLETVSTCRARLEMELGRTRKAAVQNSQDAVKKKTETGLSELPTGLSSSVKDFLPLLQLGGVLGNTSIDDQTGIVTVALNTPFVSLSRLTRDNALQVKALIETKPKLFDPIRQQLPTTGRDALVKDLLATPNRQNVTVQLSSNVTTRRLGRNFGQYAEVVQSLFDRIVSPESRTQIRMTEQKVFEDALDRAGRTAEGKLDVLEGTTRMVDLPARPGGTQLDRRVEIERAILRAVEHSMSMDAAFDADVRGSGLDVFGQLINNQPQLHFMVAFASRDDLFGPDQVSARATYEMGMDNNVNAFVDSAGSACEMTAAEPAFSSATCVAALKRFTSSPETRAAIKAGTRLSLYGEFVTSDDYSYQLPEQGVSVIFGRVTKVTLGGDFGRLLGVTDDGAASARVDASARFDWSSDSSTSQNRLVASVTFTKKFGEMSIPFGLRYASKTEFLSDYDHQLSANVGLKFNLFPGSQ